MTHVQTVCTRPFFFLPRAKHARLPTREKEGVGTRLVHVHVQINCIRVLWTLADVIIYTLINNYFQDLYY